MSRPLRIASLCSGYGGLTMSTHAVLGGELAWYAQHDPADRHQYAARIMAHHWPGVPNHGDITTTEWDDVEPVDVLEAGFPCQPVSNAGKRKGAEDDRWLWPDVARAVRALRPRIVLLENVAALLGRGMHAVLGGLAALGFDAQWITVRASDVGAPHQRARVFILAWPADAPSPGLEGGWQGRPRGGVADAPDPADDGRERARFARPGRLGSEDGNQDTADAQGDGRHEGRSESARLVRGSDAALGGGTAAADADGEQLAWRPEQDREPHGPGFDAPRRNDAHGRNQAPADAHRGAVRQQPVPDPGRDGQAVAGVSGFDWDATAYAGAVARWERVLGRPAPTPVDDNGRLAPVFAEWLMGLPEGHVTAIPGIPRSAQLKALGNGVVPQQGAAAIRLLLAAAGH